MSLVPSKRVGLSTYLHINSLSDIEQELRTQVCKAERLAQVKRGLQFNLVRIDEDKSCIALLNYPEFDNDPFPPIRESWLVNLNNSIVSYRTYAESLNPPILHRKELLLPEDDPRYKSWAGLTSSAESVGLFDNPKHIGYQRQWFELIREKGYQMDDHSLVPIGNEESESLEQEESTPLHSKWKARRHLTAMSRYGFSAPIQSLARYGFLDGANSIFDYGCGRGDDIRGLTESGLPAIGWDPFYAPDNPVSSANIVNLGFVVNVIEDYDERVEAITRAWSLAEQLLVVSVMLSNNARCNEQFRDGVMTSRGTFQKYFTQSEIKVFLEQVLGEEPIPVAPGVLYVFRDKDMEQRFMMKRYQSQRNRLRVTTAKRREYRQKEQLYREEEKYQTYRQVLERLWLQWVSLGRKPDKSEVSDLVSLVQGFGTYPKALRFLECRKDLNEIEFAAKKRIEDLEVYFALNRFERRRPYKHLESGLQRDIKTFFGNYTGAQVSARELLFRIADTTAIREACQEASEHGLGWAEDGMSLHLHTSMVDQLPALLRVYVGCAAAVYGDYRNADLVKIHIDSGKVSLMSFEDFDNNALPRMLERVKIKLREQEIVYFDYGEEFEPPFLYQKSRFINEEFPNFPEQIAFEEALDRIGLLDFHGYGPKPEAFIESLKKHRVAVNGMELMRADTIPNLDEFCGQHLIFRQLIHCGETQEKTKIENLPKQPESYNALHDLAVQVLDPVIDYFGMIQLTFGFCSAQLSKEIPARIAPSLDQHAAHELNRKNNPICKRLGAAVDFIVEDESMLEVAQWIVSNTPFDRLYFYGDDRPIHVSYGPDHKQQIVCIMPIRSGKLMPRIVSSKQFLQKT